MTTTTRKIGLNRGKRRLWLQGKVLSDAGFKPGDQYDRGMLPNGGMVLMRSPEGRYTVSGKGDLPIIDIIGRDVVTAFQDRPLVRITLSATKDALRVVGVWS